MLQSNDREQSLVILRHTAHREAGLVWSHIPEPKQTLSSRLLCSDQIKINNHVLCALSNNMAELHEKYFPEQSLITSQPSAVITASVRSLSWLSNSPKSTLMSLYYLKKQIKPSTRFRTTFIDVIQYLTSGRDSY